MTTLSLTVARFDTAFPRGPAYGTQAQTRWAAFAAEFRRRREGAKDGLNFVPARFKVEPDGRVRRLKENVLARTAIALDCETSKTTGETPPDFEEAARRVSATGWAAIIYTSHNHTSTAPRYRLMLPLSAEIPAHLPAVEVIADLLGLTGVLDHSKIGPASLFYLPSCAPGCLAQHQVAVIEGGPVNAVWMQEGAGAILAAREAIQAQQRAVALAAAEQRRAERIKAGFDPDASIIEAVRDRLDLEGELLRHGYRRVSDGRYLYPDSQTGIPGVYLMTGGDGVRRAFSHHSGDPLAAGNLPSWCRAKAVDAVDVVAILDHGGDLKAALRTLATRFGIGREHGGLQPGTERRVPDPRRKEICCTAFRLLRMGVPGSEVLDALHEQNGRRPNPLPPHVIGETALWAAQHLKERSNAR